MSASRRHGTPQFEYICDARGQLRLSGNGGGVIGDGRFFINDQLIGDALLRSIPPELADLLDVAVAVYLADRLARRAGSHGNQYEHHWQRSMHVTVPVRNPDQWNDSSTKLALREALVYLTEDDWTFDFTKRSPHHGRPAEEVGYLFEQPLKQPVLVALFSGGLDSLAGVADDLSSHSEGSVVLVSANTNRRILPVQRALVEGLRGLTRRQIEWTVVHFGLHRRKKKQYEGEERSQRTRGFAFSIAGAVVSLLVESEHLRLYENGIGAINLPYTDWQLGAQNTRAMHPAAISLIETVIRRVSGRPFALDLPNVFRTKGELCTLLEQSPFASLATRTISCDGFPQRVPGAKQCGVCSSCLLRRQALNAAQIPDVRSGMFGYRYDVFDRGATITPEKRYPLEAMLAQARRMRNALGRDNSWTGLCCEFPALLELPEFLAEGEWGTRLARMYSRYADETLRFGQALPRDQDSIRRARAS